VGLGAGAACGFLLIALFRRVIMPRLGNLFGILDFGKSFVVLKNGTIPGPDDSSAAAKAAGAVILKIGLLINNVANLIVVAAALFVAVKIMHKLKKNDPPLPPDKKDCFNPECLELPVCTNTRGIG
jgi:large conductance mechanosensitive channel